MKEKVAHNNQSFLKGGGEMGALIRNKNWSDSLVGSPDQWPQSLRTTLSIILNSKFPMFLWWGKELVCFYNDAYRPSLGEKGKHPSILGMRAEEAWPEIWAVIKPMIDQVMEKEDSVWMEDQLIPIFRNGKLEDVYWTFSYSPVKDETDSVGGVLVTCTETTEKITVLKEIKDKQEQYNFTIEAAELGIWDLNPITNQVVGNDRLKEWFGSPNDEETLLSVFVESIVERDKKRVMSLIEAAMKPGSTGQYEALYAVINKNTKVERTVLARGKALFDENGKPYRFSGTLQDMTQQVKASKDIQLSEERFRTTVQQAPVGITILRGPEFFVEMANESYLELVDRKEKEFVGRSLFESLPEVKEAVGPLLKRVFTSGEPFYGNEFPVPIKRHGKTELRYFNFIYKALREAEGQISGIIVVVTDVTSSVQAKEGLAESERQFRNLVMQSPIPMTIFRGREYIIEVANTIMVENIWRKDKADLFGKKLLEVFPELNDQKYPALLKKVYDTGITHRENESLVYVQGDDGMKKFYLDYEYAPLFETDGSVSGLIVTVNDVTEKVEARIKVEESEKRFRNVANSAPVLIWMSDTDKLCNYFNRAWLNFTGRTMAQENGNGWVEGIHADDLQRCLYTYVTAFEKQEEFYMELRLKRHDGKYRWLSNHGVPRFTLDGTFEGYIGACMDINERIIYQKKLKEDEDRLNIVIEASEMGTWELNLETREMVCSKRYYELLGFKENVIVSHEEAIKRLHPSDLKIREQALKRAYETGFLHYESRVVHDDRSIHWVEAKGKVFYDDNNKPMLMIGTIRDITSEKLFQQKLQEREHKFRLLADSMPQHVWTGDADGNLDYFNQSVYDYSGLTPEQIANHGWLQIVHPDDREENVRAWLEAVRSGQDFLLEHRFRRHDGEYRWQLSRAIPQTDIFGNIQMWVGTSTDIQDQKTFTSELERQVLERTRELEQKNKDLKKINAELQSFAYISSHDLQEPLRKIQIFAGRVLEKEKHSLSENGQLYFSGIQNAAKRMQTLIEDLLAYSRTNDTERVFKKIDLGEIIHEVKYDFKETLAEKNGVIELQEICVANVIPFQVRQLFYNLISNSIKFAVPDRQLRIRVRCRIAKGEKLKIESLLPHKTYCHVSISDNGIGFDPQYKERIFEVFQRLHGKEEYTGTGIGLAIVKKIVDNHNGIIMATGELNQGATFDIYFPA